MFEFVSLIELNSFGLTVWFVWLILYLVGLLFAVRWLFLTFSQLDTTEGNQTNKFVFKTRTLKKRFILA